LEIGHQRNLKFYLAMYVAAAAVRHAHIPPDKLLSLDVQRIENGFILDCYKRLWKRYQNLAEKHESSGEDDYDSLAKGPHLLKSVHSELKRRFAIRN